MQSALNSTPQCRASPPVLATLHGRAWRLDGRRLGLLGSSALQITCSCGHSGKLGVIALVSRYGPYARVRDALASLSCARCGGRDIHKIRWLG